MLEMIVFKSGNLLCAGIAFGNSRYVHCCFTANSCPNVTSPSNGYVNQTTVKVGDLVEYNCSYGYWLNGESTRLCDANCTGNQCQLSGVKPTCDGGLQYNRYLHSNSTKYLNTLT